MPSTVPSSEVVLRAAPFDLWSWDPFHEMDRIIRSPLFPMAGGAKSMTRMLDPSVMKIDIKESASAFELLADVPGVPKSGVKVELSPDNTTLHISAEQRAESSESGDRDGWTFHREERSSEHRSRAVRLPPSVDPKLVSAKVEEGVLRVTLPKRASTGDVAPNGRTPIPVA